MFVLDDVNTRSLEGFGCESFPGVSCTGFTDGDCLWDLSLGLTGDGKLDEETFLGRESGKCFNSPPFVRGALVQK
jgi:hypothetical protein